MNSSPTPCPNTSMSHSAAADDVEMQALTEESMSPRPKQDVVQQTAEASLDPNLVVEVERTYGVEAQELDAVGAGVQAGESYNDATRTVVADLGDFGMKDKMSSR